MMTPLKIIGIYGGNFDPVHNMHLRVVIEAVEALMLSKVIWVPTGNPPHRTMPLASATDRLKMLQIALDREPLYDIDATDLFSPEPTYTVHGLMRLRKTQGDSVSFVLILGQDAFLGLPQWHDWKKLFDLTHIAVVDRLGHPMCIDDPALAAEWEKRQSKPEVFSRFPAGNMVRFSMPSSALSSSQIRAKASQGLSLAHLVPEGVRQYICDHHLYQKRPNEPSL